MDGKPIAEGVVSKANSKLFLFMRLFKSNDLALLCRIFKVYVRPIVETCSSTFVVTTKKEVEQLESVQRRFTKSAFMRAFPGEDLPDYRERCRRMELETLEERRIRSDLILAKKILLGKCAAKSAFRLRPSRTRGGATKFDIPYSRTKMRESTFFVRVATTLSKLNADFVLNSSLGVFKDFVKDLDLSDRPNLFSTKKKKRCRHRRQGMPAISLTNMLSRIQVFPMRQYRELRSEYLSLKKEGMKGLKAALRSSSADARTAAVIPSPNEQVASGPTPASQQAQDQKQKRKRRRTRGKTRLHRMATKQTEHLIDKPRTNDDNT
ncbi:hypothetical protein AAVH_06910 [Aphelenchoides avenae]|nr:hypothetical protein AAVH_06910 [Aphelenchus avenae]